MSRLSKSSRLIFARTVALACSLWFGVETARAGWPDHSSALRIENVSVLARDAKTATLQFDISWADSWRHEANHDAAWVFFKVRPEGATEWQHVRLAADKVLNPTGYGQEKGGTPLDFIVPDGKEGFTGLFVRRAEYGIGKVAATKVTALWDLAASKGTAKDAKPVVQALGIEMVFVPEGPFYLGGGTEPCHFCQYTDGTQHTLAYRVTSAGAITTGRQAGKLWARRGAEPEDGGEISAAFPNGYAAFYCMKKHIIARQYTAFLNALTAAQADARYPKESTITRSGTSPNYVYAVGAEPSGYNVNGLSWADGATFAAWAGLRPMTELEYEKITRGPIEPGWDTGDSLDHPSYWEVRDINGWRLPVERPVTIGHPKGRDFKGTHGQGAAVLPADWPQEDAVGAGIRGGHGAAGNPSNRLSAATVVAERPRYGFWRGVRTAPKGVGP
jgi:formylglycine-generating enzyme required for sulfatase activity